jgi:CubicO group peptidase (beta-lactamase class C family)
MNRQNRLLTLALLSCLSVATAASAQELPTARAESVGMSTERLARIDAAIDRHIAAGTIANAVTVVTRRGKLVHYEAHGFLDPVAKTPMRKDALFAMASSSKPVTAAAILNLVDEGLVRLDDPVSRFVPEFASLRIAVPKPGTTAPPPLGPGASPTGPVPDADYQPLARPLQVKDLLTHTAGLMSGGMGTRVSVDLVRKPTDTLADYVPQLGKAALDFQPGTRWSYSATHGYEVLGYIIEKVTGKTLPVALQERIFEPLQMSDTSFVVPDNKKDRLNRLYRRNAQGGWDIGANGFAMGADVYFSGGVGLHSTARDYARFEQMLLNGGQLNGRRVLSPRAVELMRSDYTDGLYHGMRGTEDGVGFGLGVAVTLDETKARLRRSEGSAGWEGAFGTMSWNDPREEIVGVIMLQQNAGAVHLDFGNAILQAITESNPPK